MMRYGFGAGRGFGAHAFAPGLGLAGVVFGLLVLAAIVLVVVMLVHKKPTGVRAQHAAVSAPAMPMAAAPVDPFAGALAIAANRLANGEITTKQYEEIRAALYGEVHKPE